MGATDDVVSPVFRTGSAAVAESLKGGKSTMASWGNSLQQMGINPLPKWGVSS